ncbi:AflYd/sugR/sugar regulator [Colletotrichum abscissum]|uniref:AflYd/sugR/sugar regulator n=1 Tax=Colletotrichum abscissum TaxID=1671311 RepID=A0A9Q0B3H6_9PEZI|nr:AflYd/sugR/sugar regulator [Colletotrichum abscissum]
MEKGKKRTNYPCDGCSLRRVRCHLQGSSPPCNECRKRSVECTFLRVPRKRGPKGPRLSTTHKVVNYQEQIRQNRSGLPLPARGPMQSPRSPSTPGVENESTAQKNPLEVYIEYLDKFRDHLTCVWPVVNVESLKSRISGSLDDHDAWALSGAICATVIAQLRLSQLRLSKQHNLVSDDNSIAESFAHHAQLSHNSTYYKEDTTDSLLTAFFLHIYFANTERIRLATVYLHEAIAQLHLQSLHRPEILVSLADEQRELLLRIFWLVFVTERTFCVQNCFPPCLKPIQTFPLSGFHIQGAGEVDASFQLLAQLFTLLDDNIVMAADRGGVTPGSSKADNLYSALSAMAKQDFSTLAPNLPETQRVNVLMTGNWIHILWWQFALSHYQMSSRMDDAMLSMLKPAKVAHEAMRLLGSVSQQAIRTHGYGLELKVFRIADALIDILACNTWLSSSLQPGCNSMLLGARDVLHSLQKALLLIGGPESLFHKKLMLVMAESQLPVPNVKTLTPCEEEERVEDS